MACWPSPARPAERKITPPVTGASAATNYVGQRNILHIPGQGYWVFFKATNPDRAIWRFSPDGQDWKATDETGSWVDQADVFPFTLLAPDAAWSNPSIWYASNLNRIYVTANDAASNIGGSGPTTDGRMGDATGNKLFLRWGTPSADGAITWNPAGIRRQRMTMRNVGTLCQNVTNGSSQTWDPLSQRSAVVVYSSSPATGLEYVALFADANRFTTVLDGLGVIGLMNLTRDATGYIHTDGDTTLGAGDNDAPHVYAFCHEAANAAVDGTLSVPAPPAAAPVYEGGTSSITLVAINDNWVTNAIAPETDAAILSLGYRSYMVDSNMDNTVDNNTVVALNLTPSVYKSAAVVDIEGYGASVINDPVGYSSHSFVVLIDNSGGLAYRRRIGNGGSFGTVDVSFVLDASGTAALPLMEPTISIVSRPTGLVSDLYIAYISADLQQLNYFICPSTVTAAAQCSAKSTFRLGAGFNNPKLGFWTAQNQPLPIVWSNVNDVYFDKIITSTFPVPGAVAGVSYSTVPAFAYRTTPRYELQFAGSNFEALPNGNTPYALILEGISGSSETQTSVKVTSATWVDKNTMRASIELSTFVQAGLASGLAPYDIRLVMPDGQEYPTKYDRSGTSSSDKPLTWFLPKPVIDGVSDPDPADGKVSGGAIYESDGTASLSRAITISGSEFFNWSGLSGTILPSTNTVKIQFQKSDGSLEGGITVASMSYSGSTGVTAYLKISTSAFAPTALGSGYTISLTNPSSGTVLSLSSTFYVTVPTATVTDPDPTPGPLTTGFTVIVGSVGFNNLGQTSVSAAQVRIRHVSTGKFWNGTSMTTSFGNEELKWRPVTSLYPSIYTY
ncbi:MAG: hypothetical protein AAB262_15265, partial [Elusimicrobiota bacterium]